MTLEKSQGKIREFREIRKSQGILTKIGKSQGILLARNEYRRSFFKIHSSDE